MWILNGLPGTTGKKETQVVRTSAAAIRRLQSGCAATFGSDNGSLNVWIDDDGKFRCESYRYRITQSSEIFDNLTKVKGWLKEWIKKIQ